MFVAMSRYKVLSMGVNFVTECEVYSLGVNFIPGCEYLSLGENICPLVRIGICRYVMIFVP
jgi:hypothetical protein